jgi:ABC-type Co2+ transport system permease subunit
MLNTALLKVLVKYVIQGTAVAVAMFLIPRNQVAPKDIMMIAVTAATVFLVLDLFAPAVAEGARTGTGFGLGAQLVGWPGAAAGRAAAPMMPNMPTAVPSPIEALENMEY